VVSSNCSTFICPQDIVKLFHQFIQLAYTQLLYTSVGTNSNLGHLFEVSVVRDEAIGVVTRGRISREAITLAELPPVAATSLHDVSVNVEIGEERQHQKHVAGEQI